MQSDANAYVTALIAERFDAAAAYLHIHGGFDGFRAFAEAFNASLGIPSGLGDLGVTSDMIPALVEDALSDPSCGGNPVPLTADNLTELFRAAL